MSDAKALSSPMEGTANSTVEVFAGLIALCVWLALFIDGKTKTPAGEDSQERIAVLFRHPTTNVAMLCCVASVLGGVFRRMQTKVRRRLIFPSLLILVLQGFVVYLFIATVIISHGGWDNFSQNPAHEKYIQHAATCSLISWMIGYSPGLFNSLMGRLEKWLQQIVALQGAAPTPKALRDLAENVGPASMK